MFRIECHFKAHMTRLGFGGQRCSGKGEVQRFCYRAPACWHYRSSLPLYRTLPADHLGLLHSTRLLTSIFKRTATYIHIHRPLSLASLAVSPQVLPSSSRRLTENFSTLFWTTAKRMSSTQEDGIKQQITLLLFWRVQPSTNAQRVFRSHPMRPQVWKAQISWVQFKTTMNQSGRRPRP